VNKLVIVLFISVFSFSSTTLLKAQSDCCGLGSIFQNMVQSGIFGGYGIQQYSAKGLNEVLPSELGFKDFGTAWGWRVGANILGFRQKDILISLKFYYQSMTETQNVTEQEIKLIHTQFSLGMSFPYIISKSFDIRIFDVYIIWNNAELTNAVEGFDDRVYESPETNIGFTADGGLIYYPFPPYISLGILGGYSIFSIDEIILEEGESSLTTINDFIDGGGFFAMAVITIGIPFN